MKNKMTMFLVCVVALLGVATSSQAQTLAGRSSPRRMEGMRAMGMGGAFSAVKGTDENALFYNPAAINDFDKKIHMQFALPTVEFSYRAVNFVASDLMDLADDIDGAASDAAKVNVLDAFAAQNTGRYEEVGLHGNLVTFMHKWVTASIFYDNSTVIALTNPASSTVDVEALTQAGLQVGSAYSFFDDRLQVGAAIKLIERHLIDETITQRAVVSFNDFGDSFDFERFGFGFGVDLGVKGRPPVPGKLWEYLDPVFALTLQDVGHTRFSGNVGQSKESLTGGLAIHPDFWKLKTQLVLDVRDLEYATDFVTKLHAGYEVMWPEISKILYSVSLRLGLNQGYFAGGFGLDFKYFKLNAATWGREVSSRAMYQKQSRMFGVQLAAGF